MEMNIPQKISADLVTHLQNNWQDVFGDCEKMQREVLADIMKYGSGSDYARDKGFAQAKSYEEFVKLAPISEYSDYWQYINKNMEKDAKQLTAAPTDHYLTTTGTTGEPKYFAETALGAAAKQAVVDIWNMSVAMQVPVMQSPDVKMMMVVNCLDDEFAPNGIEIVRSSGKSAKALYERHPEVYIHPYEFIEAKITNAECDYMQAVYTVAEKGFNMLFCNNLAHFGAILDVIEAKPQQIIDDIRTGHFSVNLTPKDREFLEARFGARPERATELADILASDGKLSYEKIWPEFCFIGAWLCGSIGRMTEDVLRRLPESIKCISEMYGSSEAMMSVPMEFGVSYGVLASFGFFAEFLPLDGGEPVPAWQVKDGEYYEILLTTYSGLYRYNLHDIVRICGFMGTTPKIDFCCKSIEVCHLPKGDFYAYDLGELIKKAEGEMGVLLSFYQAFESEGKLNLVLQAYEDDFDYARFNAELLKAAQEMGVELEMVYAMDKGYRTALFQEQMTRGRGIQAIKLPVVIAGAPSKHIKHIFNV